MLDNGVLFKNAKDHWAEDQEHAIVSLALDLPEFFATINHLISPKMFREPDARFVIGEIQNLTKKYGHVPSRDLVTAHAKSVLTAEHDWQPIIELLERPLSPREAPMVKDTLLAWAKQRQMEMLWSEDAYKALERGDHEKLMAIVEKAQSIGEPEGDGFYSLSDLRSPTEGQYVESPWPEINSAVKGIKVGEVVAISGSTGDGKSTVLMEIAADHAKRGINVAYVDFENDPDESVVSMASAFLKDEEVFLTAQVARQLMKGIEGDERMGDVQVCPMRKRMIPFENISNRIEMMEKRTGSFHPVVVLDYVDKIRDPKLMKEHGQWLSQEMVFEQFQAWCFETGRVGFTALQVNREGRQKQAKGKARTGADITGAYAKVQVCQWHFVLEKGPRGPVLVVDKARRTGRLKGGRFEYEYVASRAEGSERGFVRYVGARSFHDDVGMKRDRLVEILKAGDLTAIEGMVRDESQGKYTGHLAVHRDAFRSWCEFDSTFEKLVADETLVLLRPGKKVRIGGEKNARSTWVVFAKHASLAEGENPNNEGGPGCAGGVAHPSKGEEMGGGA